MLFNIIMVRFEFHKVSQDLETSRVSKAYTQAHGGIAKELGIMTQLRSLQVRCVSEDHADELYVLVMKLTKLQKLSLSVEKERES